MSTLKKGKWTNSRSLFEKSIHFLYRLVEPKSKEEDLGRREFILNTLLLGSLALSFVAAIGVFANYLYRGSSFHGASLFVVPCAFIFFLILYILSRKEFFILSSYIFVGIYFLLATYTVYSWGADVPQGLLTYVLVIIMSGVLISTRFAFIVTLVISILVILISYFQIILIIKPDLYWRNKMGGMDDVVVFVITFCVIAIVSWLSNREIERSLRRARGAEKDLRAERDLLEIKVKERTEELERAQFEKTKQMQNFVEFGRNASGLFHDMVNPVQASLLSLEQLKNAVSASERADLKEYADEATDQMEKARKFINTARNQIARQEINIKFDPEEQIALVFQMLSFKAKREKVALLYSPYSTPLLLTGNPLSFHRLLAGLVSNAIDAYDGVVLKNENSRTVIVHSKKNGNFLNFSVRDNGKGISGENQKKIFELFFTTKGIEKGTGVGLALCKEIIEKEFGGALDFESNEGVGSIFTIKLPFKL